MSIFPSDGAMRERFHALTSVAAEIEARAKPLRDQYNELARQIQELEAQQKALVSQFREIEAPLFEVRREQRLISAMLAGKTGEPPNG